VQVAVIAPDHAARPPALQELRRPLPRAFRSRSASSRASSPPRRRRTPRGLAEGDVDIVIGTHALLAKGIKFKNLGLLIIDEEQHFGVQHKERLKALRSTSMC
jgi:transcription-repair coupling factor (superfamily II helicase)